jgi:hypothetical protein
VYEKLVYKFAALQMGHNLCRYVEESNETIRATLEVKVRDLSFRAAEYDAEATAVGACG